MTKGFWIWRDNLTEVLTAICHVDNFDSTKLKLDEIKHGLTGTSDKKDFWFDYRLNEIEIKLSVDSDDNDIVHVRLTSDLDDKTIEQVSTLGTTLN